MLSLMCDKWLALVNNYVIFTCLKDIHIIVFYIIIMDPTEGYKM